MTPQLSAWAARTGRRLADRWHCRRGRSRQTAAAFLSAELPKCGALLSGMMAGEVTEAFVARVAELERQP